MLQRLAKEQEKNKILQNLLKEKDQIIVELEKQIVLLSQVGFSFKFLKRHVIIKTITQPFDQMKHYLHHIGHRSLNPA